MPRHRSHQVDVTAEAERQNRRSMAQPEQELARARERCKGRLRGALMFAQKQLAEPQQCYLDAHVVCHTEADEAFCLVCFQVYAWRQGYEAGADTERRSQRRDNDGTL